MDAASVLETAAAVHRGDVLIDVRTAGEFASGHVPHAVFMTLDAVPLRLTDLPRRRPVYVECESGSRAAQVYGYLDRHGFRHVHVRGGMAAWRAAGLPVRSAGLVAVGA